jgi:hypothetical protein
MIALSENAKKRFDDYLRQVRNCLRDCVTVDRDEVERNVIDHIENELANAPQPVSSDDLEHVLDRLGSPTKWVPEEQVPWWRKILLRLQSGPDDWRLAYISFGLLILAFLFARGPTFIILLLASFALSRAAVSMVAEPDELRGKQWLIYPSLVIVYVSLLCLLLLWPLLLVYSPAVGFRHNRILYDQYLAFYPAGASYEGISAVLILLSAIGLWWTVLGIIALAAQNLFKLIFRPFADGLKHKWAVLLLLSGILLVLLCLTAWLLSTTQSGHFIRSQFPQRRLTL